MIQKGDFLLCFMFAIPDAQPVKKHRIGLMKKAWNMIWEILKQIIRAMKSSKAGMKKSGLTLKRFFNTSGQLYKSMELKDKLPTMSEDEQLKLLATDGMLVKRPIVVTDDDVLVGFKEKEWIEVFGWEENTQ